MHCCERCRKKDAGASLQSCEGGERGALPLICLHFFRGESKVVVASECLGFRCEAGRKCACRRARLVSFLSMRAEGQEVEVGKRPEACFLSG